MADVFYFNTPPRLSTALPPRLLVHAPHSPCKRRRTVRVEDSSHQQNAPASVLDPDLCSPEHPRTWASCSRAAGETSRVPPMIQSRDQGENDGDGGVRLGVEDMAMLHLGRSDPSAGSRSVTETLNRRFRLVRDPHPDEFSPQNPYFRFTHSPPHRPEGTSRWDRARQDRVRAHPRPDGQGPRAQEHSRRRRFARDGEDTIEVSRFGVSDEALLQARRTLGRIRPGGILNQDGIFVPSSNGNILGFRRRMNEVAGYDLARTDDRQDVRDDRSITLYDSHVRAEPITMEDDYLAVDDPRWNYDVLEFVDSWRMRSLRDKRLPLFNPGLQPAMKLRRPSRVVCAKDVASSSDDDMQGIHWHLIGHSRMEALQTRAWLHPSKRKVFPPYDLQQPIPIRIRLLKETVYRFRNFVPMHHAQFSHYQLRNLLAASNRSDVFYANASQVFKTSLACPSEKHLVMDHHKPHASAVDLRITCLASTSQCPHLLFAGGFNGEYAMLDLHAPITTPPAAPPPSEGIVTHAYNGIVTHIEPFAARTSGLPTAAFCSNDGHVRLLDAPTQHFTASFAYGHPINCSARSPDARLRVIVGDSPDVCIADAEKGDVLATLSKHGDHAFACAWAPNAVHVATGAQDGETLVWDARNWSQPLHKLPSAVSCPRSLHFGDDGALVVAEEDDVVSVYDGGRDYVLQQELRFFGAVAGVALLDGGEEVVVANADRTVGGLLTFERATTAEARGGGRRAVEERWEGDIRKMSSSLLRVGRKRRPPCGMMRDVVV